MGQVRDRAIALSIALVSSVVIGIGVAAPPAGAAPVRDVTRFACPPGLTTPFTDVGGTTHETAIACALHYDLTGGTSATTYSPGATVSRGQMATFLMRLLGFVDIQPGEFPSAGFADTAGSPHERSIDGLVAFGIAQGTSRATFSPGDPVSRAQMATFLDRTLDFVGMPPAPAAEDAFDDDDGNPHEAAIQSIADHGIAGGTAARTYSPGDSVARGSMASFLVRVIDLGIEQGLYAPNVLTVAAVALDGADEVPGPGDADGTGTGIVATTDVPGVICVDLDVRDVATPTAAHLHLGGVGEAGAVAVTLPTPNAGTPISRCVSDPDADTLGTDPEAFYLNVHTGDFPDGAVRGQLGAIDVELFADLVDGEVVPGPGDTAAIGAAFAFTTTQPDVLCAGGFAFTTHPITAAALFVGAPGVDGTELIDVEVVSFEQASDPNFTGLGLRCVETTSAASIAADPGGHYVEVATTEFPDGAVRGQLQDAGTGPLVAGGAKRGFRAAGR